MRVTAAPTSITLAVALAYVLFRPAPFIARDFGTSVLPWMFVAVHSVVLVGLQSRVHTSGFAFLYSRGFSRDTLWVSQMIASALSVLMVWVAAAVCVRTGLRSWIQEHLMRNPEYPVMASADMPVLWLYLVGYVVALPTLHYAWIRRNHPTRGQHSGDNLIVAVVLATFTVLAMTPYREGWALAVTIAGGVTIGLTLLIIARRLHRRLEVQQ
jgi:hypothetical protein